VARIVAIRATSFNRHYAFEIPNALGMLWA